MAFNNYSYNHTNTIAAPQSVINVRIEADLGVYHDLTQNYHNGQLGDERIPLTGVDVATDLATIDIKQGELVFTEQDNDPHSRNSGNRKFRVLKGFSVLNRRYLRGTMDNRTAATRILNDKGKKDKQWDALFSNHLQLIGLSPAPFTVDNKSRGAGTQMTVQIGGTNAITNVGETTFSPGDLVAWALPEPQKVARGVYCDANNLTPSRVRPVLVHASSLCEAVVEACPTNQNNQRSEAPVKHFYDMLEALTGVGRDYTQAEDKKKLTNLIKAFILMNEKFNNRVVGRALSSAAPGDSMHIHLGNIRNY